jgi:hypothetical protein
MFIQESYKTAYASPSQSGSGELKQVVMFLCEAVIKIFRFKQKLK